MCACVRWYVCVSEYACVCVCVVGGGGECISRTLQ